MGTADKDGSMAQIVSDLHACLGISLHESLRAAEAAFVKAIADIKAGLSPSDEP